MDTKEKTKHWGLINEVVEKKDVLKKSLGDCNKKSQRANNYSSIKKFLEKPKIEKELPSFKILRSLETVKKVYGSHDLKEDASSFKEN